jgi:hypothetical protein
MAEIHKTTLTPTKLELLTEWLPRQPWYRGSGIPLLAKAGGFRLDDPAGKVGIEFVFVRDESGAEPIVYQVPLSYRDAALGGGDSALVGNTEHGVLGTRWVYDGSRDPVAISQLFALLRGEVEAQEQSISFTVNRSVAVVPSTDRLEPGSEIEDDATGTRLASASGTESIRIIRVLETKADDSRGSTGQVSAEWHPTAEATVRGPVVLVEAAS